MDKVDLGLAVKMASEHASHLIGCRFLENSQEWITAWHRFDLRWSDSEPRYVTIPEAELSDLLSMARKSAAVFRLMNFVAATQLEAGQQLSDGMKNLVLGYLKGEFEVPRAKDGRPGEFGRDFIIINSMRTVMLSYPVKPTRNRVQKGARRRNASASEIVSKALAQTDIGDMSVERIQKIWGCKRKQADHDKAHSGRLKSLLDDEEELVRI